MEFVVYLLWAAVGIIGLVLWVLADGKHSTAILWLVWLGAICICTAVACWYQDKLWVAASIAPELLQLSATTDTAESPPGYQIAGISWMRAFREVHVLFANPSDAEYRNLDLVIRPDAAVAAASLGSENGRSVTWKDEPNAHFEYGWDNGKRLKIPMVVLASERGIRVRCDSLAPKSTMDLVIAAVTVRPQKPMADKEAAFHSAARDPNYWMKNEYADKRDVWFAKSGFTEAIFGSPPKVTNIEIAGKYKAADQTREFSQTIKARDVIGDIMQHVSSERVGHDARPAPK